VSYSGGPGAPAAKRFKGEDEDEEMDEEFFDEDDILDRNVEIEQEDLAQVRFIVHSFDVSFF